jgi:hypothetical protein
MEAISKYSFPLAISDLQAVLEVQYKDLKRLGQNKSIDSASAKELQHRKDSIASLENVLGCIHEAEKNKAELKLIKENTIKFIETFNTIFKQ